MNNEKEHWVSTLINSIAAKVIAFALLGLLILAVFVGLCTNKHVNILGIEFNGKDTIKQVFHIKPDTIITKTKDTVFVPRIIRESITKSSQNKNRARSPKNNNLQK